MIRIYLDWSVISGLKTEKYAALLDFIRTHKDRLLFVYTPAHFNDLMKSHKPDNINFDEDLNQLEWLCGNHLVEWFDNDWQIPGLNPTVYFRKLMENQSVTNAEHLKKVLSDADSDNHSMWNFGKLMKEIFTKLPSGITISDESRAALQGIFPDIKEGSSQWEMMEAIIPFIDKLENDRDSYKSHRRALAEKGVKLDDNAGNWDTEEVFKNIDIFLKSHHPDLTFKKYVEMAVGAANQNKATIYDYFTTAYLLLDLIGFKPDKLPKVTDSRRNIRTDADHAFFASICDYFVTEDKNLSVKAKVLYKEFSIFTQILTANQVAAVLTEKLHHINEKKTFINEALTMLTQSTLLKKHLKEEHKDFETDICEYELPVFYFDFFTKVDTLSFPDKNLLLLNFYRPYSSQYFFSFPTETDRLVRLVLEFFGHQDESDIEDKIRKFIYDTPDPIFQWNYNFSVVQLSRNANTKEPELLYCIKIEIDISEYLIDSK